LRWGADGKARQLEEMYSYLRTEDAALSPNGTFGTPVEQLDVETVIKISQTVSGEMDPQKLIDTLMRTAMELAGGERSLLVLSKGTEQRVEAKAATSGDTVIVEQCDEPVNASVLPETLVRFVLRTRETVILHDAAAESPFMADPYIDARQVRSVLCLPLISRAELVGALYLENNLATGVFMPARIAVLKVLALQAAIALENARLYRELAIREAKIRRLVDANIVGVLIWDADGRILEANDAFLRVVGYERADLTTGRLRWTELTPPEWLERDLQHWMPTLQCNGRAPSHEKEYIRKDGSRVPVVVGAAVFEETRNQGVGFVLDLTRLKHAEAEARENAQRHREIQAALARASRVTAMGQLAAMISHEANQPIAAVAVNAEAGLRWLSAEPPKLDEARQAFEIVIGGAARATDVIDRICGLVMNQPSRKESLQMNEVIQEVVVLMVGEAKKCGVSVSMDLADDLPLVVGDRVQLQQVILNLMINALEAMSTNDEESRDLNISTRKCQWGSAAVKVCDSGPGIVIEKMGHIFEPFVTTKPTGTGIGLSICRTIVQAHGGQLRVSANMPRGAVFEFTVPALSEPAPVIAHRP
jgi:PAS domain S-box-containing protein